MRSDYIGDKTDRQFYEAFSNPFSTMLLIHGQAGYLNRWTVIILEIHTREMVLDRSVGNYFPTNNGNISDYFVRFFSLKRDVGFCEIVLVKFNCPLLKEYFKRLVSGIAKRKPGDFITGLNMPNREFRIIFRHVSVA